MAQIGSFIPASKAEIDIVDRIFTCVEAGDNLAASESTKSYGIHVAKIAEMPH
ncbi:MAG: hypothetical protein LBD56_00600 [Endomicrobium sp.]|jgi:DNA mismatch repair protein MutS|nr:hypothetical protein [Endomicrobium sp.]